MAFMVLREITVHQFYMFKKLKENWNKKRYPTPVQTVIQSYIVLFMVWEIDICMNCLENFESIQFLSTPPGSVPSAQLFSSAGLIYEPLRNKLGPEKAAILLFMKCNNYSKFYFGIFGTCGFNIL